MNPNKIKKRKREWRIFHHTILNNDLKRFSCISNHHIQIPKCDQKILYSLNIALKGKLKNFYKAGYKGKRLQHVFNLMRKIHKLAMKANQNHHITDIFKLIKDIIPREFLGTPYHCKLYMKIVKKILTRSKNECVFIRNVVRNYNFANISWLKGFNQKEHINYLYFPLIWSLDAVKYVIRKHFYFLKHNEYPFRLELVPHRIYTSFKQKVFNEIFKRKYAIPVNVDRNKIKGVVQFIPKGEFKKLKFRPLLKLTQKRPFNIVRRYCQYFQNYATNLSKTKTGQFYKPWLDYLHAIGGKKIYCITVDVSDAFGRVDINILTHLISHMKVDNTMKQNLLSDIRNQYITFMDPENQKAKIYRWNHGLLQGDHFSGPLCNLYMSYMDSINLSELLSDKNNFIHRTTDDYIFVSTIKENVEIFLKIMKSVHVLKYSKIATNVEISSKLKLKKTDQIKYCGLLIDTNTKEILPNFHIIPKTSLHGKFKIWNPDYPVDRKYFLIKSMRYFYNTNYFVKTFLNGFYNKPTTIIDNYYKAMIYLAFKFDLTVEAIYNPKEINHYGQVVGRVVLIYAGKSFKTIQKNSNKNQIETDGLKITFQMLVKVGYCAFFVVLRKRIKIYETIVKEIRKVNDMIFIGKPFNVKRYLKLPKDFQEIRMTRTVNIRTK